MMKIADRIGSIPFSGIRKVFEEVARREKLGEKIIHLEIGRPDFDTPHHIKAKAQSAIDEGLVHYSSNYGIPELRAAIARKLKEDNGLRYDPAEEIAVTVGANEAVFMTMMGLLDPGDEVLIPDPCWLHYFYCARLAGAVPISVPTLEKNAFHPSVEEFRSRLTPRTRMLVINTPNNPTGAVYPVELLEELGRFARENDLFVLSDEIYEKMVYEGNRHVSIGALPGMRERTLTINGFSKIYAMDGWRLGYVAAERQWMSALIRVHQYTTVCATTFAQWGAVAALNGAQTEAERMLKEFDRRRNMVAAALKEMPGIRVAKPMGAFYILPNIAGSGMTPLALTQYLLDKARIAVVPGPVFGECGNEVVRISYANSYENLEEAMGRMNKALKALR